MLCLSMSCCTTLRPVCAVRIDWKGAMKINVDSYDWYNERRHASRKSVEKIKITEVPNSV